MRVNIHSFFLFSTVPSFLRREINQNRVLQINVFLSMFTIDLFSKLSKREIDRIATMIVKVRLFSRVPAG